MTNLKKELLIILILLLLFSLTAFSDETNILNSFEIEGANFTYDIETGNIESKDLLTLKSKDFLLSAKDVTFDVKKEEFTANQGVNLEIGNTSIKAKIVKVDFKSKVAILEGNVIVNGKDKEKRWGIISDLVSVKFIFTDEKKQIQEIETKKRSKIYYDVISGEADSILYSNTKRNITLSGNVKIIRDKNTILAEKVIIDLQAKKIITKGKVKIIINEK